MTVRLTRVPDMDGMYSAVGGRYLVQRDDDTGKCWTAWCTDDESRCQTVGALHLARALVEQWETEPTPDPLALLEPAAADVVADVAASVATLAASTTALMDACTAPDASDLLQLLADVRETREALLTVEQDIEHRAVRELMDDEVEVPGVLRATRYRSRDRKEWRHEDWQRDVRQKALRKHGLLGAAVFAADGTEVPVSAVFDAIADAQSAHGAGAPKVTTLKALGLDAGDYCSSSPGRAGVRITRLAEEVHDAPSDVA